MGVGPLRHQLGHFETRGDPGEVIARGGFEHGGRWQLISRRNLHRRIGRWCVLENWTRLAGESPVRVDTGVPGSRPQSAGENWLAERGVKSLRGGSNSAGRNVKRILQPRQINNEGAEPLISRRRPCPAIAVRGSLLDPSGVGGVARADSQVQDRREPSARVSVRPKTARISRW
jgi:hypothetical protein